MIESESNQVQSDTLSGRYIFRAAISLAAAPLVTGVCIFALWAVTRQSGLEEAGLLTIFIGIFVVAAALLLLLFYLVVAVRQKVPGQRVAFRVFMCLTIIVANFFAAIACISGAGYLMSTYVLTVENRSNEALSDIHITGPGVDSHIESLDPNELHVCKLHFSGEGELAFSAKSTEDEFNEVSVDYVTRGIGADRKLAFLPEGGYKMEGPAPRGGLAGD